MFPSLQRVPFKLLHYCLIFKVQPLSRSVCFVLSESACILYQPQAVLSTAFFIFFSTFIVFLFLTQMFHLVVIVLRYFDDKTTKQPSISTVTIADIDGFQQRNQVLVKIFSITNKHSSVATFICKTLSRLMISQQFSFRFLGLTIIRYGTPRRSASANITPALTKRSS